MVVVAPPLAAVSVGATTPGSTVDEPTAITFTPGQQEGGRLARRSRRRACVASGLTGKLRMMLTLSPGVRKPPTAWVWSRLTVIACLPFGMAPDDGADELRRRTNWSATERGAGEDVGRGDLALVEREQGLWCPAGCGSGGNESFGTLPS